jgi:hypothetical protein
MQAPAESIWFWQALSAPFQLALQTTLTVPEPSDAGVLRF